MRSAPFLLVMSAMLMATACGTSGGAGGEAGTPDDRPASTTALYTGFSSPTGLAFGPDGEMYVSNWSGGTVERIGADGERSIFLDDLDAPSGLAVDRSGVVYVADYSADVIYRATAAGEAEEFATGLHTPAGISFDAEQNLLVANRASDEIVSVGPDGRQRTVATGLSTPVGVVADADGTLYVSNYTGGVSRIGPDGEPLSHTEDVEGLGVGMVIDDAGELFVVDRVAGEIKRVLADGSTEPVRSGLDSPVALAADAEGVLHTATWGDAAVYEVPVR